MVTSGEPVSAEITISGGDIIINSDADGYYHRILLPGTYSITFSADGYQEYADSITITDVNQPLNLDIIMSPDSKKIASVK